MIYHDLSISGSLRGLSDMQARMLDGLKEHSNLYMICEVKLCFLNIMGAWGEGREGEGAQISPY